MKMEQAERSETLAFKLQTPVNHPEASIKRGTCLLVLLVKHYSGVTIKEAGMDGGEITSKVSWGNLKEEENLEEVDGDGRIILKLILMNRRRGVDWSSLICNRLVTLLKIGPTSEIRASIV
jgi:hypothetical protein